MSKIFELGPGDYLITDDSHLFDFIPLEIRDTKAIWRRIETSYGIALSDAPSEFLGKIFEAIAKRQNLQ